MNLKIVSFASQNPQRQNELVEAIRGLDADVQVFFAANEDEAVALLADADVLLAHRFTETLYDAAKNLKWVHITGAGIERSLFEKFIESDVMLTNSRGLHARPMAEWVLGALYYWAQRFDVAETWRRDRHWQEHKKTMTRERLVLAGRSTLVVGYGEVGKGIAELLLAAGLKVEGIATSERKGNIHVFPMELLEERLEQNEIVILTLPSTNQTRGLFNRRLFPLMKDGSILVNVGRGALIDETDLIAALKQGKPAYALLDVFADEPLPEESELFSLPNVFLTPHVSGNFPEYTHRVHEIFAENVARYLNGVPLNFVVDKRRGY
ncbi:MAG: D-2-hydroxyacid dehydrogenase [Calditrichaeota bacterium]|nr:D-2-hydroxyacid dehydrogenase [Calditrichota bacterium]MCB9366760.1 D-2-hydroxyacid dehydrogenase [Calditrichota bacterium]MCB9391913.1 D-2-hydroxyacid dehydrogenase [Calditrichota bacterium]